MGKRGPARDTATDERITELVEALTGYGFEPRHVTVAAVLSVERGEPVTAEAVRNRRRRMEREAT